jgi:hypothetical protein
MVIFNSKLLVYQRVSLGSCQCHKLGHELAHQWGTGAAHHMPQTQTWIIKANQHENWAISILHIYMYIYIYAYIYLVSLFIYLYAPVV